MKHLLIALWGLLLAAAPAMAQDNYRIQPGDTVAVEVLEDQSLNRSVLVLPDGTINFPFVGTVQAGGRTVNQLQSTLTSGLAPNFASEPNVFVTVNSVRPPEPIAPGGQVAPAETISIYFTGEIRNVGRQEVEPGTTLLQAIAIGGGFTEFAATKRIQLRRAAQVYQLNYRALSNGAKLQNDPVLQNGDVILVPERRLFE